MTFYPSRLLAAVTFAASILVSAVQAQHISTNSENVAIDGYGTVAYFTEARPVQGSPEFQTEWQDATWQFSSVEHQAMFEANPEKYAPRFGGFCAGVMSLEGQPSPPDPRLWRIVDGNLFLATKQIGLDYLDEDAESKLAGAEANWKALTATN